MPTVIQTPHQTVNVRVNNNNGLLTSQGGTITVTSSAITADGITRLDQLDDVVEVAPSQGDSLLYNAADDKYVVGPINIDGGFF
jgi:hypothetical protein